MNWLKLILLDVLVIADFFGSTMIVDKIVRSVPEGTFPPKLRLATWFVLLFVLLAVTIAILSRFRSSNDSS